MLVNTKGEMWILAELSSQITNQQTSREKNILTNNRYIKQFDMYIYEVLVYL